MIVVYFVLIWSYITGFLFFTLKYFWLTKIWLIISPLSNGGRGAHRKEQMITNTLEKKKEKDKRKKKVEERMMMMRERPQNDVFPSIWTCKSVIYFVYVMDGFIILTYAHLFSFFPFFLFSKQYHTKVWNFRIKESCMFKIKYKNQCNSICWGSKTVIVSNNYY